jgi:hypothetical protein
MSYHLQIPADLLTYPTFRTQSDSNHGLDLSPKMEAPA